MEDGRTKLRPIVYTANYFKRGHQNTFQQMFLLKALQVTQDPKKLRDMIGVKSVAEVYRTLDKMAMRKEYHEALARSGISFDYIVSGLKGIADTSYKDDTRLKAYQVLLKSVGLDTYKDTDGGNGGSWEEELLKKIEEDKNIDSVYELPTPQKYDVVQPQIPESARKSEEEESDLTSSIYDDK